MTFLKYCLLGQKYGDGLEARSSGYKIVGGGDRLSVALRGEAPWQEQDIEQAGSRGGMDVVKVMAKTKGRRRHFSGSTLRQGGDVKMKWGKILVQGKYPLLYLFNFCLSK